MTLIPLEEIERLKTINEQLGAQVHEIRTKQSAILLRLNELSSTTRNLPSEILATIFSEVCLDPFRRVNVGHPLIQVVSRVCSRWRHVAKNTPSLWTHIEIMLPVPKWATMHSFNLLRLYYANSGMLPLAVSLSSVPEYRQPPSHTHRFYGEGNRYVPYTDILRLIFVEFPSKLGSLSIGEDADINRIWLESIASFTTATTTQDAVTYANLAKLDLKASYEDHAFLPGLGNIPPTRLFQSALHVPRLYRLAIHYDITSIQIPLQNLTSLTLMHSRPKECIDILAQHPGLIEFCAMELDPSFEPPQPPLSLQGEILPLTNLQKLSWDFGFHKWDMILMGSFRFPRLSSLYAHNHRNNIPLGPDASVATAFINQWAQFLCSLPTLHTLGCGFGIDYSGEAPTQFFNAITNISALEELHLWAGMYDDLEEDQSTLQDLFLSQFLSRNPPTSQPDATHSESRGLPMVKSLHLHDSLGDFPSAEQVNSFLDALESRWRISRLQTQSSRVHRLESCTLYILPKYNPGDLLGWPGNCEMIWENWTPRQLKRLAELKEEGLEFRLEEQDCGSRCEFRQ